MFCYTDMTMTLFAITSFICISVIHVTADYNLLNSYRKNVKVFVPYGPKMCLRRCDLSKISCNYMIQQLSCIIVSDDGHNISKLDQIPHLKKEDNCSVLSEDDKNKTPSLCLYERGFQDCKPNKSLDKNTCDTGEFCFIKRMLSFGNVNISWVNHVIIAAAQLNQTDVLAYLINHYFKLNAKTSKNINIFLKTVTKGYLGIARMFLESMHFDIESKECGVTPLIEAAYQGHLELFKWLVCKGANLSAVDEDGDNILTCASVNGRVEMVDYILSLKSVNIDHQTNWGDTAVLLAARGGHLNVIRLLVENGCNLTIRNIENYTILHLASASGNVDVISYVLKTGLFDIDAPADFRMTPLLVCVENGNVQAFQFLRENGASTTALSTNKSSILHFACRKGHTDMVKHIIKQNLVDKEAITRDGLTPLLIAVENANETLIEFLLGEHCYTNDIDNEGNTGTDQGILKEGGSLSPG